MFALYYKEPYAVKEESTRNRSFISWRGKQIAICEEEKPLQDYKNRQKDSNNYYIEPMGF